MLVLIPFGGFLTWYGWTIVDNIWGPGDSPDWAYLLFGLPFIVLGVSCVVGAALAYRRSLR